jgi:predicted TIM-barrel fold metal-dependent hydrolase
MLASLNEFTENRGRMLQSNKITRRQMLLATAGVAAACCTHALGDTTPPATAAAEPIIDIHQHTTYHGRSNAALLHHQKRMGVTKTILLPGGSPVDRPSTLKGKANGLYAGAGVMETCTPIVDAHRGEYYYAANEVPDLEEAKSRIEGGLKNGAVCIGEQKFNLPCDSSEMEMIYALAQEYNVPVLLHFQYEMFNTSYERFGKVLEKWPKVNFIGHSVTFWSNIDADFKDQKIGYPTGKIKAGGMSDKYLSDHENFYGDLSAGSGLNALTRDEEHARGFIERHQDKLLYGSDCPDPAGFGPTCTGANIISAVRRLSPSKSIARKLLYHNANKLFRM